MKELNDIDSSNIISSRLSQSKSYLKILDILYFVDDTNLSITADIIERVIQISYLFDNIILASCPHIIKVSELQEVDLVLFFLFPIFLLIYLLFFIF